MERMGGSWIGWNGILPDIDKPDGLSVPRSDTITNARIKRYLYKDVLQVANDDIFPTGDFEIKGWNYKRKRPYDVSAPGEASDPERSLEESKRRAKSKVRDIALCNHFGWFFTWTLDGSLIDRYDAEQIYKKLRAFLSNSTQRHDFQYVCIPEYHKKKVGEKSAAIHFHGLCNLGTFRLGCAFHPYCGVRLYDAHGRPVFNMLDWKFGFSTCVPLDHDSDSYEKTVSYITKYITKADDKIFGKWYLSSRSLRKKPDILPVEHIDFDSFRDDAKLATKEQYEVVAYLDVKILNEEFKCD